MDLDRVANPLSNLLRGVFMCVVLAAAFADFWLIGELLVIPLESTRPSLLVVAVIAALGIAWAVWPSHVLVFATAASVLSLLQTSAVSNVGLRIGIFTEFVVLPVFLAAVLSRTGTLAGRSRRSWSSPPSPSRSAPRRTDPGDHRDVDARAARRGLRGGGVHARPRHRAAHEHRAGAP